MVAALELSSRAVLLNSTAAELRVTGPDASVAAPLPGPLAGDPATVATAAGAATGPIVTGVNASAAVKAADMKAEGVGSALNESAATLRATIMSWLQLGSRDGLDTFEVPAPVSPTVLCRPCPGGQPWCLDLALLRVLR
jgi:hypothetical protein